MANLVFVNRDPDYSDLNLDFKNPAANVQVGIVSDVMTKSGDDAIKRSIRNLISTNFYERPFRSFIGSGVRQMLFENAVPFTGIHLEEFIRNVINNFEPRVRLLNVRVSVDEDRNGFNVELQYVIINREQPVSSNIFLERVR